MPQTIHIIEPTLAGEAGHCHSFVDALCKAGRARRPLALWADRAAETGLAFEGAEIRRHFSRRLRKFQAYFLYRRLLAGEGKMFVSTATYADLRLAGLAARGTLAPNKAFFYVHWFNPKARKLEGLRALARKQPNFEIYAPTPSVAKVFEDAGFARTRVVPYPISQRAVVKSEGQFRHLLYAGAARADKGFAHVVNLVEEMHKRGLSIPVVMQTSAERHGKYDAGVEQDVARLQAIGYAGLQIRPATLSDAEYADLYRGALCLQLYNAHDFADRISGVTLDAFSAGSPVISTDGSWIARMVRRFGAGAVVSDVAPPTVLAAVEAQIADYQAAHLKALAGGAILQDENSANMLYELLAHD